MAESATVAVEHQGRSANSGEAAPATGDRRGALTIDNRVGEKIAARAALDIDGVERHSSGLGVLGSTMRSGHGAGADYPRARVDMTVSAPTVALTIVIVWPAPVASVCRKVRSHVADELARLTGMRPSKVDVTVTQVISRAALSETRSGFVELDAGTVGDDTSSDETASAHEPSTDESSTGESSTGESSTGESSIGESSIGESSTGESSTGESGADGPNAGRSNDQKADDDKADDS